MGYSLEVSWKSTGDRDAKFKDVALRHRVVRLRAGRQAIDLGASCARTGNWPLWDRASLGSSSRGRPSVSHESWKPRPTSRRHGCSSTRRRPCYRSWTENSRRRLATQASPAMWSTAFSGCAIASRRNSAALAFIGLNDSAPRTTSRKTASRGRPWSGRSCRRAELASRRIAQGLLVHLGGCEGASQSAEAYRNYGEFVLKSILASGLAAAFSHKLTIVGGARCIASLQREFGALRFEFISLSPAEMNARVRAAALVLTAPGPTNVLECFHLRSPVCFLPPQNYSQWSTLRRLDQEGLAPWALNWDEACPELPMRERMPEVERKPVVQEALRRMTSDDAVQREFAARLGRLRQIDLVDLARRQTKYFRGLGPNGAQAIARQLRTQDSLLQGAA